MLLMKIRMDTLTSGSWLVVSPSAAEDLMLKGKSVSNSMHVE